MTNLKSGNRRKLLKELFNKMNISDLPAMSNHVQELISLTNSNQATAQELTDVILKDYSLTSKLLQVANSAYYARGVPVSTISRAVTVIGFDVIRKLAAAIAIFDDLIKKSSAKEHLGRILTKSFISATIARILVDEKKIPVNPEDAFLATLLYYLGEVTVFVYLPSVYTSIIKKVTAGMPPLLASKSELNGLTFLQIGQEIARFWKFSEIISTTMVRVPPPPKNQYDEEGILCNLVVFCNHLTGAVCRGKNLSTILNKFGKLFGLNKEKTYKLIEKSIEASEDTSSTIRQGLAALNMRQMVSKSKNKTKKYNYN
jgi:eukaryotic-like serine/threonine-protein kinase